MDSTLSPHCPARARTNEMYSITFTEASPASFFEKLFTTIRELFVRISLKSLYHAWSIGTQNDLSKTFARAWKPGSFVTKCPMPIGTVYLTADANVIRTVLQNPRKDKEGLFYDHENKRLFVEGILTDIFPEDVKKYGVDSVADMIVISADAEKIKSMRAPLLNSLGAASVKDYIPQLNSIANNILDVMSNAEKENCNAEELAFEFAITVISKFITGYETNRQNYKLFANALNAISKRMSRIISRRPATEAEKLELQQAISIIRNVIDDNINSEHPSSYISKLKVLGWNDFQIRISLFFNYFAGTETTAGSINYLLWELGKPKHQHFVTALRQPDGGDVFLHKLVTEALRLHPPAFIEGRQFRCDTNLEIRDKAGKLIKQMKMLKGYSIVCLTQVLALDPDLFVNPQEFNPHRFDHLPSQLPWLPFGAGTHVCPGQYLALTELRTLIPCIVKKFDIETLYPKDKTDQSGFLTLRATPALIKLKPKRGM
ncbi:MAG: cytochrome P450 [Gammaproteobacteria bacterium]|nr:cytochrome P450 [Gammaproteobacteria bacterium]